MGHNNYGVHNFNFNCFFGGHKWTNPLLKGKRYKERQGNGGVHNLSQFIGYEIPKTKLYSSLLLAAMHCIQKCFSAIIDVFQLQRQPGMSCKAFMNHGPCRHARHDKKGKILRYFFSSSLCLILAEILSKEDFQIMCELWIQQLGL